MTADRYVPSREGRFSFGIWTVGRQGVDVFGGATRPPMPAERAVRKLAELGAYGVNFHDNDVFDFGASPTERDERIAAFRKALDETGLVVTTATTNLFGHPVFKEGGFTANDRECAGSRSPRSCATSISPPNSARGPTCSGAQGRGRVRRRQGRARGAGPPEGGVRPPRGLCHRPGL